MGRSRFIVPSLGAGGGGGTTTVYLSSSIQDSVTFTSSSALPTAPTGSDLVVFNRPIAGLPIPHVMLSGSLVLPLGTAEHSCRIIEYSPGNSTTVGLRRGWDITQVGTLSHPNPVGTAGTGLENTISRSRWTSGVAANNAAGFIGTVANVWRGNAAGRGGFFFFARWSTSTPNTAGTQCMVGMAASYPASTPSDIANSVAMGWDTNDSTSGSLYIHTRDASAGNRTAIPGSQRDTSLWDTYIYAPPNASVIYVTAHNRSSGTIQEVTLTNNLPDASTMLIPGVTRNTVSSGIAQVIDCAKFWLRSNT